MRLLESIKAMVLWKHVLKEYSIMHTESKGIGGAPDLCGLLSEEGGWWVWKLIGEWWEEGQLDSPSCSFAASSLLSLDQCSKYCVCDGWFFPCAYMLAI